MNFFDHKDLGKHLLQLCPKVVKHSVYTGAEQNNGINTDTAYFLISMVLDHFLPSVRPQSFLEWSRANFEQSVVKFYTIPLEEHLQVALEMLEVGICSPLYSLN
jgi:hypothetical protein